MNGRFLLDTNIVIALFANESAVIDFLNGVDEVFVPSIVMGELYYGARKSIHATENILRLDDFATISVVLSCDIETSRRYGEVKDNLRKKGRPIPENDV